MKKNVIGTEAVEEGIVIDVQAMYKYIGYAESIIWKLSEGNIKLKLVDGWGLKFFKFRIFLQNLRLPQLFKLLIGSKDISTISEGKTVIIG